MQQLLFRDWRFALLWAIGLTASAAAFVSAGGGHEELAEGAEEIRASRQGDGAMTVPPEPAAAAAPDPAVQSVPVAEEDEGPRFGEPQLDTTPLDPTPQDETIKAGPPAPPAPSGQP